MRKFWLVARHEYRNMTRRRSFIWSTIGLPLLIAAVTAISALIATGAGEAIALGYVDHAGVIADSAGATAQVGDVLFRGFSDEVSARGSLEAGALQAYYVLPADYRQTGQVQMYYGRNTPTERTRQRFDAFLRANLVADQPTAVRGRVDDGVNLILRSADGRREVTENGWVNILLPFVAGMFFTFATMMAAGYLLQAITTEKENRTVEVMATSLSPLDLVGGKAVGLMAVALTQLLIWIAALVVGLVIAACFWPEVAAVRAPWGLLGVTALFFLPTYALVAGIMVAIGGMVTEAQQGQQISGITSMLFMIPLFLTVLIFSQPDSPLIVALTLFPTTSFLTILMRWGATVVPIWQLAVSWVLLVAAAGLSVWAAARIFRIGMLRYGQPLNLVAAWAAVRR